MRLAAQETMLVGTTLQQRWDFARTHGYDGIEVRTDDGHAFAEREPELVRAIADGVVISSVSLDLPWFLGDPDPARRLEARAQLRDIIGVAAAIEASGIVVANACGIGSKYLPPYETPLDDDTARAVLVDGLRTVAAWAELEGAVLFLEPLNRFEDYAVNTLREASSIVDEIGSPALRIVVDTYHAGLEEAHVGAAIRAAGDRIAHVQLGDSNRLEPGRGHYDWVDTIAALVDVGYDDWLAVECFLSGPPAEVLAPAAAFVRRAIEASTASRPTAHAAA